MHWKQDVVSPKERMSHDGNGLQEQLHYETV